MQKKKRKKRKLTCAITINAPKASFHQRGSSHQGHSPHCFFAPCHCSCFRRTPEKCTANMTKCLTFGFENLSSVVVFADQLFQPEFYPAVSAVSLITLFACHRELIHYFQCHTAAASRTAVLGEGARLKAEALYAGPENTTITTIISKVSHNS